MKQSREEGRKPTYIPNFVISTEGVNLSPGKKDPCVGPITHRCHTGTRQYCPRSATELCTSR